MFLILFDFIYLTIFFQELLQWNLSGNNMYVFDHCWFGLLALVCGMKHNMENSALWTLNSKTWQYLPCSKCYQKHYHLQKLCRSHVLSRFQTNWSVPTQLVPSLPFTCLLQDHTIAYCLPREGTQLPREIGLTSDWNSWVPDKSPSWSCLKSPSGQF